MALDNTKNFAKVTVSIGYDAVATSIVLTAGHGAKLPTAPFNVTWWNFSDYPDPTDDPNVEIVRVTAISTDTLTVTRAQEGTSATTKNTASKVYKMIAGLTAKVINADIPALSASGIPFHDISTIFETSTRFNWVGTGSASRIFGDASVTIMTGATINSGGAVRIIALATFPVSSGNPQISIVTRFAVPGDGEIYFGGVGYVTNTGTAHTFTDQHIGWKSINSASVETFSATNANGTAETATAITSINNISALMYAVQTGSTNIKFYSNRVLKATHTTNLPTVADSTVGQLSLNNKNTATGVIADFASFSYRQDLTT